MNNPKPSQEKQVALIEDLQAFDELCQLFNVKGVSYEK